MTDWHQKFAKYYEDVLRASAQSSGRSLTRVDKLFDRGLACDLEILGLSLADILEKDVISLVLEAPGSQTLEVESDALEDEEDEAEGPPRLIEIPEAAPGDEAPNRGERTKDPAVPGERSVQPGNHGRRADRIGSPGGP
jgi:hypothetical protein